MKQPCYTPIQTRGLWPLLAHRYLRENSKEEMEEKPIFIMTIFICKVNI
jgi:hypothetical protein